MQYRTFNTGDQIWVRRTTNGREVTAKVITHDGMIWSEDEPKTRKITGVEYYLHWITVKIIQGVHWVMNV